MKGRNGTAVILFALLLLADASVWQRILTGTPDRVPVYRALDVGQGDATLISLPGGASILTDAGSGGKIISSLEKELPGLTRIDIAVISHPQLDHFGGFNYLLDRYRIGTFVINGRDDTPDVKEWPALLKAIEEKNIPIITLKAGDSMRHGDDLIEIISPGNEFLQSGELNDTGLIEYVSTTDWKALLTADTGMNIEEYVFATTSLQADILKVGHHGSKYSTGEVLLRNTRPRVATISVGAGNTYGHPASSTLSRLEQFGAASFRTDISGTVTIKGKGDKLKVLYNQR